MDVISNMRRHCTAKDWFVEDLISENFFRRLECPEVDFVDLRGGPNPFKTYMNNVTLHRNKLEQNKKKSAGSILEQIKALERKIDAQTLSRLASEIPQKIDRLAAALEKQAARQTQQRRYNYEPYGRRGKG